MKNKDIFDDYLTDEDKLELLFKIANLTNIEILLIKSYVLKYNQNYTKMAKELNSSVYITKKLINLIINKLIKASIKLNKTL